MFSKKNLKEIFKSLSDFYEKQAISFHFFILGRPQQDFTSSLRILMSRSGFYVWNASRKLNWLGFQLRIYTLCKQVFI